MKRVLAVILPVAALAWPSLFFSGCVVDLGDLGEDELEEFSFRAQLGDDREHCNGPWICNTWNEHAGWQVTSCFESSAECQTLCTADEYGTNTVCGYNENYDDYNPPPCDGPWICNNVDSHGNHLSVESCHGSQSDCQASCSGPCGYNESYGDY